MYRGQQCRGDVTRGPARLDDPQHRGPNACRRVLGDQESAHAVHRRDAKTRDDSQQRNLKVGAAEPDDACAQAEGHHRPPRDADPAYAVGETAGQDPADPHAHQRVGAQCSGAHAGEAHFLCDARQRQRQHLQVHAVHDHRHEDRERDSPADRTQRIFSV